MARWPLGVRTALEDRVASVRRQATGSVLELDPVSPRVGALDRSGHSEASGSGLATVISLGALTGFADLSGALAAVVAHLEPEGQFLFVEPVGRPGWRSLLLASAGASLPGLRGQHLGRDVPLAIRASGLTICAIDRFEVPTATWPLRNFVQGRAVRFGLGDDTDAESVPSRAVAEPDEDRESRGAQ